MQRLILWLCAVMLSAPVLAVPDRGDFDIDRWYEMTERIRSRATSENISESVVNDALHTPALIPSILKSDATQSEFTLTMDEYLGRMINDKRIADGKKMRKTYPTLLSRVNVKYGVPPHIILAFWGLESNYGTFKARHQLTNAFFTLIYDGRRESFFMNQLIALMKIADKNKLDINNIHGSWAGAMGHFQFIPTTLAQYGTDGNGDRRIDIISSITDAMFSAGNYLNKLGWNKNERIVRPVILPSDFDLSVLDGKTKKALPEWAAMGITNPDGSPIPQNQMMAGLVADTKYIESVRADIAAHNAAIIAARNAQAISGVATPDAAMADAGLMEFPSIKAYLTYPNFYRIKKWNNSNWYAIAIAELADKLK